MAYYPEPVARLIEALQKLPGVGPKSAQRMTFFLLKRPVDEVGELSAALTALKTRIVHCSRCFNVTEENPCRICSDPARDARSLCVIEEPNDLLAVERTGEFKGRYHVLMGALSPLDGIGPEDIRVRELLHRLDGEPGGHHHQPRPEEHALNDLGVHASGYPISFRPSRALLSVTSSAYSRSPPTGRPRAMRVMRSPSGFSSLAR